MFNKLYAKILFSLMLIVLMGSLSFAQVPSPLKEVDIAADIEFEPASGIYTYKYKIYNPPVNSENIARFEIDMAELPGSQTLKSDGLEIIRGEKADNTLLTRSFKEEVSRISELLEKPVIPVGARPPLKRAFPGWTAGVSVKGSVSMGGSEENLILPRESLEGFEVRSYGMPGIRSVMIRPSIDYDGLPDEYHENVELTRQLENSLIFHAKTVGPVAPPAGFDPIDVIDHIIDMQNEAVSLGWITGSGNVKSLGRKLENAKIELVAGDRKGAGNILNAFLGEVDAQGCLTYDDVCPEGKQITPEAYSLLMFNVKYMIERIRPPN